MKEFFRAILLMAILCTLAAQFSCSPDNGLTTNDCAEENIVTTPFFTDSVFVEEARSFVRSKGGANGNPDLIDYEFRNKEGVPLSFSSVFYDTEERTEQSVYMDWADNYDDWNLMLDNHVNSISSNYNPFIMIRDYNLESDANMFLPMDVDAYFEDRPSETRLCFSGIFINEQGEQRYYKATFIDTRN